MKAAIIFAFCFVTGHFHCAGAEPVLVKAQLITKTKDGGDNKDTNSGVFVMVVGTNGTRIASAVDAHNNEGYDDGETNTLQLALESQKLTKSHCQGFKYNVGLVARGGFLKTAITTIDRGSGKIWDGEFDDLKIEDGGNDKWNFDAWLRLTFSDKSTLESDKLGQTLKSIDGRIAWLNLQ